MEPGQEPPDLELTGQLNEYLSCIRLTDRLDGRSISMNYLVPSLLHLAGVRLSPYYQYMLDIRDEMPILLSRSVYFDGNGREHAYEETGEYADRINTYLYLEYNNLQRNRRQALFAPYPGATE